jgi:hypothetical protein
MQKPMGGAISTIVAAQTLSGRRAKKSSGGRLWEIPISFGKFSRKGD